MPMPPPNSVTPAQAGMTALIGGVEIDSQLLQPRLDLSAAAFQEGRQ